MMSNAASHAACKADAARLCPGVAEDGQLQCLKRHKDALNFGCAKELAKLELKGE